MIIDGTKVDPCEHWMQQGIVAPFFGPGWPDSLDWMPSDTEEKYIRTPADFKEVWNKVKISYDINSWGFRSPEIDDSKKLLPFFGCSFTFGIGMPVEHTYPYLMAKDLGIDYVNFAIPGGGYDGVYRLMKAWLPLIDCDYVVTMDSPTPRVDVQYFNVAESGYYNFDPNLAPQWYRKRFPDYETRWKPKQFITVHVDNMHPESDDLREFKLYAVLGDANVKMAHMRAIDAITHLCKKYKKTWIRLPAHPREYPFWELKPKTAPSKVPKYADWKPPGIDLPVRFLPSSKHSWEPLPPDERGKYADLARDMEPHPGWGKQPQCGRYLAHPGFWFHRFAADIGVKRINDLRF
jgi:hypothetical protein